jgi:hypothetical protein
MDVRIGSSAITINNIIQCQTICLTISSALQLPLLRFSTVNVIEINSGFSVSLILISSRQATIFDSDVINGCG